MKIAILHDQITDASRKDETDALVQARTVAAALEELGHEWMTLGVSLDLDMVQTALRQIQPDLCFNLVEAIGGHGRLIHVIPGLLDAMRIPYTGVSAEAQFLTSNKLTAKMLMRGAGIPTPNWFTHDQLNKQADLASDRYIIKSVWEHASVGLDEDSIIDSADVPEPRLRLRAVLESRLDQLGGEGFVEHYIDGREFNLALLAAKPHQPPEILPLAEIVFDHYPPQKPKVVGWRAKWDEDSFEYHHTPRRYEFPATDASLIEWMKSVALQCWPLFDLRGYVRVDFRVDDRHQPWVLEINTNPCLSSDAGFAAALRQAGIPFNRAIERILNDAARQGVSGAERIETADGRGETRMKC